MEGLFKKKYRIDSARLMGWDYSGDGFYFVTICVKNKICCLEKIINNEIILSKQGEIVKNCWYNIPNHFLGVELDEFVIMPNHVHGIIVINHKNVETHNVETHNVETRLGASLQNNINQFGPLMKNSVPSIINHFKGRVTKYCRKNNLNFVWQPRFYDHVIRRNTDLETIRRYIEENPLRWYRDRNNLENLYM